MSQQNFVLGGLKALKKLLEGATPENQPSEAVLRAYLELISLSKQYPKDELESLRRQIAELRKGQAVTPSVDENLNRLRRLSLQGGRNTHAS